MQGPRTEGTCNESVRWHMGTGKHRAAKIRASLLPCVLVCLLPCVRMQALHGWRARTWVHLGPISLQVGCQLALGCPGLAESEHSTVGIVHSVCQVVRLPTPALSSLGAFARILPSAFEGCDVDAGVPLQAGQQACDWCHGHKDAQALTGKCRPDCQHL